MRTMSGIDVEAYEDEWEDDDLPPPPRRRVVRDDDAHADLPIGRILGLHKGWVDVLVDDVAAANGPGWAWSFSTNCGQPTTASPADLSPTRISTRVSAGHC
jgi:hypothetical protein